MKNKQINRRHFKASIEIKPQAVQTLWEFVRLIIII